MKKAVHSFGWGIFPAELPAKSPCMPRRRIMTTMMMTHAASCQYPIARPRQQQQQQHRHIGRSVSTITHRRIGRSLSTVTGGSSAISNSNSIHRGGKKSERERRRMSTGGVGGGPFQVDDALVQHYAEMPIDRLTISRMLQSGSNMTPERIVVIANHVQRELAVRLARRLLDMHTLPYIIVINPNFQKIFSLYTKAFMTLIRFPKVVNMSQNQQFQLLVKELVAEGVEVVSLLAKGVKDTRRKIPSSQLNMNRFMADMIMSRISRRVIAEQYIALHEDTPGYIGIICKEMSPYEAVMRVLPEAKSTCQRTYGAAPDVLVEGDASSTCSYIPTHLEYILFENVKNAMRAVVERNIGRSSLASQLPPIKILIVRGPTDISIRISDEGGGVPAKVRDEIFDFGFSTVREGEYGEEDDQVPGDQHVLSGIDRNVLRTSPMAGLGFGLPMSRLYAQYFGGDVSFSSMEGYGSDVLIRIDHLGETAEFADYDGFDVWKLLRRPTRDTTLLKDGVHSSFPAPAVNLHDGRFGTDCGL